MGGGKHCKFWVAISSLHAKLLHLSVFVLQLLDLFCLSYKVISFHLPPRRMSYFNSCFVMLFILL